LDSSSASSRASVSNSEESLEAAAEAYGSGSSANGASKVSVVEESGD